MHEPLASLRAITRLLRREDLRAAALATEIFRWIGILIRAGVIVSRLRPMYINLISLQLLLRQPASGGDHAERVRGARQVGPTSGDVRGRFDELPLQPRRQCRE